MISPYKLDTADISYYVKLLFIVLIIAIALVYRLINIDASLPYIYDSGDESVITTYALAVGAGKINSGFFIWPATTLIFVNTAAYGLFYTFGYLFGFFSGVEDFAVSFFRDPYVWFLISRIIVAVCGIASIFVIYKIGNELFEQKTAIVAALLFSVTPGHVELSRYNLPDTPAVFLMMLSFLYCVRLMNQPRFLHYLLSGFFLGLSLATKYYTGLILLSFFLSHLIATKSHRKNLIELFNKGFLGFFIALLLGFFIGCPFFFFDIGEAIGQISYMFGVGAGNLLDVSQFSYGFLLKEVLPNIISIPILVTGIAGLLMCIARGGERTMPLIIFVLAHFGFIGSWKTGMNTSHYIFPILPFMVLLSAAFVTKLANSLPPIRSYEFAKVAMLAALVAAAPGIKTANWILWVGHDDTRTLAKRWIEDNIPANSKIVIDAGRLLTTQSPPLKENEESIRARMNQYEGIEKSSINSEEAKGMHYRKGLEIYFRYLLKSIPEKSYFLTSTYTGLEAKSLDYYKNRGYEYAVINENIAKRFSREESRNKFPNSFLFYSSLPIKAQLVKEFHADPEKRPGPTIRIYRL